MPFSISAGIGFIPAFSIAPFDGVVLAGFIREGREGRRNTGEAGKDAAEKRLILTTAMVASIGFLRMAVSTSVGSDVQRPRVTVVIGVLI